MKQEQTQFHISRLLTLGIFFLFAITLLMVILTGANIYQTSVADGEKLFETRTTVQYLSARIRRSDNLGLITLENFSGTDAVVFHETMEGIHYQTLIYCYDGWLRELFCTDPSAFLPSGGEKILPLTALELSQSGSLIHLCAVLPDGETVSFDLQLRSGQEVTP